MAVIIQIRRGTAAQWTTANTILADGEMGYEKDTSKFKFGDGTTAWNALDYIETGGGDSHFLGKYISLAALETAHATAADGDYAIVDAGPGTDAKIYIWDADEGWVEGGGTGASTFADLSGSPNDNAALNAALLAKQDADADLSAIAGLSPANDDFIQRKAGAWTNRTVAQVKVDLAIDNVANLAPADLPVSTAQAAADAAVLSTANSYTDSRVVGLWDDRGSFDASGGAYPSSGGSGSAGAILKGDLWTISVAGTLPTGQVVEIGDTVRALIDTPGNTQANWAITQNNIGYVAENQANKATDLTSPDNVKYPTTLAVSNAIPAKATAVEIQTATDDAKYATAVGVAAALEKTRDVTASFAIATTDRFSEIVVNSAIATTATINTTFVKGQWLIITNKGVGNVNITGSVVTLTGDVIVKTGKAVYVVFTSNTTAICIGASTVSFLLDVTDKPTNLTGYGILDAIKHLDTNLQVTGNVSTGAQELRKYTLPANELPVDGQGLRVEFDGNYAGNANNKTVSVEFDGVTLFTTGSVAVATASSWSVEIEINRILVNSQFVRVKFFSSLSTVPTTVVNVAVARNLATALDIRVMGQGTSNDDVTCSRRKVYKLPVGV